MSAESASENINTNNENNDNDASFESALSSISKRKEVILRARNRNLLLSGMLCNVNAKLAKQIKTSAYLVINTISGTCVEAIYSTKCGAENYLNRIVINLASSFYLEQCTSEGTEVSEDEFLYFIEEMKNDNYKIIKVTHLDLKKPVYANNLTCLTALPEEYLSNDRNKWMSINHCYSNDDCIYNYDDWMDDCKVKINPNIPQLKGV